MLHRYDRHKAAADLDELIARPPKPEATVVVAGEDKRGKSSLINALLGHPNLSPVGVETVTAAPISLYHADETEASVLFNGEGEPQALPLEQAQSLATLLGNPLNEHNVRSVQIGLNVPLLEGLVLVDTPGVGGLDSGHAALTLQSLRSADALLFVLEAGAQIRGPELRFLREAASRTSRVIFALTKLDLYRGWHQIADDNQAILREQAPRLAKAPVVAVSSVLGLRAARLMSADEEGARELWEESGLDGLSQRLRTLVTADLHALRAANIVQTGLVALVSVERAVSERVSALGSPKDTQAALGAERARLGELNRDKAEWPQTLSVEVRRLNLDRSDRIQGAMAEIRRRYDERLKNLKRQEHDALPGELVADLTALAGEMNHWTVDRLGELVARLLGDVAEGVSVADTMAQLAGDLLTEQLEAIPMSNKLKSTDRMTVLSSFAVGHSLVALVGVGAMSAIGAPVVLAAGIGLGGVFAFERFRMAKRQGFVQEYKPWMNEQIAKVQLAMNNNFQRTQIDVEVTIRRLLKGAFIERERQINESLRACQRDQQQAQGERQRQRQQLSAELGVLRDLRIAGRDLLGQATT
ncbi:MAG: dynamin family protein [Actinomycetota bacterium]|nr:dynamin family protein [Actinomycetota bacterium]